MARDMGMTGAAGMTGVAGMTGAASTAGTAGAVGTSTDSTDGTAVETVRGLVYGPSGKRLDVYRPAGAGGPAGDASASGETGETGKTGKTGPAAPAPTVLLWHGIGPDERDVLEPLARTAAALGLLVLVPDWRSDAADGGRAHLLESLAFVRGEAGGLGGDGESFVLAGWSAGAGTALGVALRPEIVEGWRPRAVVGLAGRYDLPARTTGTAPLADLAEGRVPGVPVRLVHGSRDAVLNSHWSRDLAEALRAAGRAERAERADGVERADRVPQADGADQVDRTVTLQEPDTDHAGVIMTAYDPAVDRCVPTTAEHAVRAGRLVARVLAEAAGGSA
ncbi:alpha/beta hydrolase [Streptomyces sp. NPDC048516]|uniref:alpha/beta hydrolase n=1 Tax=Streptomyces sp. NPDC048516 TaxID=3365565 RepID=UPI00371C8509